MEIVIKGRKVEVNERLRHHVWRKLSQLERRLPAATEAVVEISAEPTQVQQQKILAQVALYVNGEVLRAERRGATALMAVSAAADTMAQEAARYKGHACRSQRSRGCVSIGQQQAADLLELDRELARELAADNR